MNKDWTPTEIIAMYSEGMTDYEVIKKLGITKRQFDKLCATNPIFRDIVERGNDYSLAWNIEQSRLNLSNKEFNSQLFNIRMQNLHSWSQKVDQNTKSLNVNAEMTKEDLLKKLESYLPDLIPQGKQSAISYDGGSNDE